MSREFAVLTERAISREEWVAVADEVLEAGCTAQLFAGGLTQFKEPSGAELVSFWPSRRLFERREADADLWQETGRWAWWTDVTVPERTERGAELARTLAARMGGVMIERL